MSIFHPVFFILGLLTLIHVFFILRCLFFTLGLLTLIHVFFTLRCLFFTLGLLTLIHVFFTVGIFTLNFHPEFSPGIFTLRCLGIFTPFLHPGNFHPVFYTLGIFTQNFHPGNFHPVFFTLGLFTLEDTVPCKKHINGSTHETGVWGHHAPMNACCILMNRRTDTEGLFSSHTSHNS